MNYLFFYAGVLIVLLLVLYRLTSPVLMNPVIGRFGKSRPSHLVLASMRRMRIVLNSIALNLQVDGSSCIRKLVNTTTHEFGLDLKVLLVNGLQHLNIIFQHPDINQFNSQYDKQEKGYSPSPVLCHLL